LAKGDPMTVAAATELTERIAVDIMRAIQPRLARQPPHPNNVFVVLDALAFVVATVIVGADERRTLRACRR